MPCRAARAARLFSRRPGSLIGLPWARAFVARFPHLLDELIEFPGCPGLPERRPQFDAIPAFLQAVQAKQADLALQIHGSGSIVNPLIEMFAASLSAGYCTQSDYCPDKERYLSYPEGIPEIRRHLRLMEFLGVPLQGEHLEFPLYASDREVRPAGRTTGLRKRAYGVHRIALPQRRWPIADFADIAAALAARGARIVITGSAAERELCARLAALLGPNCIDLAGRTSLGALAVLLQHACITVCNDTGISHIAAALGAPSVVLFTGSEINAGVQIAVCTAPCPCPFRQPRARRCWKIERLLCGAGRPAQSALRRVRSCGSTISATWSLRAGAARCAVPPPSGARLPMRTSRRTGRAVLPWIDVQSCTGGRVPGRAGLRCSCKRRNDRLAALRHFDTALIVTGFTNAVSRRVRLLPRGHADRAARARDFNGVVLA